MTNVLVGFLVTVRLAQAAGGTALDAFNFVTGARAAGMGGAAVAVVSDVTALQWNPAGLARSSEISTTLSHLVWVADINYSYAGVAVPVPAGWAGLPVNGTAGFSVQMFNYGSIESTRGLAAAVDASDLGFTAGGAVRVAEAVSGGAAVKVFHHALGGAGVSEAAIDAGAAYEAVPDALSIGLVVQNLGYSGSLEGRTPPLPASMKLGFGFGFEVTREPLPIEGEAPKWHPKVRALLSGDIIAYQRGEPVNYTMGAEANLNGILYGRVGLQSAIKAAGASAGLSGGVGLSFYGFRLDYAYGSVGDLGHAQYVSLSWSPWHRNSGAPAVSPKGETAPPPQGTAAAPALLPGIPTAEDAYRSGAALYGEQKYAEAAGQAQSALDADPNYWEAWQLLGNCRFSLNDRAGALAAYGKSLALHPDNPSLKAFVDQLGAP
ncbi:MAG: PorV/PorQ family protein [Candidatus Coatesbacteria bacterium]